MVVTNPPFGTKSNEGIDLKFLEAAQESFYHFLCSRDPARRSARAMVREDFAHYGYLRVEPKVTSNKYLGSSKN